MGRKRASDFTFKVPNDYIAEAVQGIGLDDTFRDAWIEENFESRDAYLDALLVSTDRMLEIARRERV